MLYLSELSDQLDVKSFARRKSTEQHGNKQHNTLWMYGHNTLWMYTIRFTLRYVLDMNGHDIENTGLKAVQGGTSGRSEVVNSGICQCVEGLQKEGSVKGQSEVYEPNSSPTWRSPLTDPSL